MKYSRFMAKTLVIVPIHTETNKGLKNHSIICHKEWIIHRSITNWTIFLEFCHLIIQLEHFGWCHCNAIIWFRQTRIHFQFYAVLFMQLCKFEWCFLCSCFFHLCYLRSCTAARWQLTESLTSVWKRVAQSENWLVAPSYIWQSEPYMCGEFKVVAELNELLKCLGISLWSTDTKCNGYRENFEFFACICLWLLNK